MRKQASAGVKSRALRVCLVNLGCPKNQVDSEIALGAFRAQGFVLAQDPERSDILIVNTCAFIRAAEEETIQAVLQAARLKKNGTVRFLLVVGCWVAKRGERTLKELVPEIDAVALPGAIPRWLELIGRQFQVPGAPLQSALAAGQRPLLSGPGTAFLKVAEGCSRRCSFCLIPSLRGPLCSRPEKEILQEAKALARRGALELVLVAQDTTRYGADVHGRPTLVPLLKKLAHVPGVRWVRVMYAYPDGIGPDLIELMAREKKLCHYLDMPLQHAHPRILKAMGRAGNAREYLKLLERLRSRLPDVAVRTTLLTGFPGETEIEHQALLTFVQAAEFDRLGVFAFSPEPGTRAAALPGQVPWPTRERRKREIMELQQAISRRRLSRRVGQVAECLIEEPSGTRHMLARTRYDAPEVDGGIVLEGKAAVGTIVRARITGCTDHDFKGVIL